MLAVLTALVILGALFWIDAAFDAVPLHHDTDPDDGCRTLTPMTRATLDRHGLPPLVLLTGAMVAAALLLASRLRLHLSTGAGRVATTGLVGAAALGAGLSWTLHASDNIPLLLLLIAGGGGAAALVWTPALLVMRARVPRMRDSDWLLLWLLPLLLTVLLPFVVAGLTPTDEFLACPGALD